MEINYELKPTDIVQYGKEIAPTQKSHQPMVVIYFITFLVFIFADVIFAFFSGSLNDWEFAELLMNIGLRIIITFAAILIVLAVVKLIIREKSQGLLKEPTNGLFCEHKIILTENELIELTDVNTSRFAWKAIGEIKELENFVLINVLMSSTYIIPKRYFQNREHLKTFLVTANSYQQNADKTFHLSHLIEYEKSLQ